ncbi:ROK family transcriptional regulator [Kribbella sp. CA-293567]|uniref:ROK family transcriptional regulator n=1 Tax=Kribbella sp. CA-293567 TaxID=3002436 RepID=UPI0022DDA139|nr:ROK family transcriptional regulator [Kribbella sp. CA-293567]WBQ08082.1 ROK family transcriptional regulator [Kribbella sp. CA-293567]
MSSDQPPAVARRGTNLDRVGGFNDTVVLDAIRRADQRLSRVEIAAATGLSGQAISNITRRLLDAGLVREAGRQKGTGLGKPRTLLELEPTGQYAVGVHLDPAVVTTVMLDLTGQVVVRDRTETPASDDPGVLIAGIAATVERVISEAGAPRERVVGVGIAAPGPIDVERGVVIDPPNLSGWHLVPLRDALRERTGLPVLLDKDVTAAASAEKWAGGPNGRGSFVFFYLGTGVGAGLVIGDEVVRGSSSNVGEIGHVIVDPDGPLCYCGRHGCVGETSQPRYLVQQAVRAGVLAQGIDLDDRHAVDLAFAELCRQAAGPGTARELIAALAGRIAKVVEDIANLLDLERVVFGGPHWDQLAPFFDEVVRAALEERFLVRSVHPFVVTGTALGADVGAVGAASLVLDHTFSPNPSVLLLGPAESAPSVVVGSAER